MCFPKRVESLSSIAKTVSEKTEKVVEDSKPVMKKAGEKLDKAVDDVKPVVKKAAEAVAETAENIIKNRNKKDDDIVDGVFHEHDESTTDEDFERGCYHNTR